MYAIKQPLPLCVYSVISTITYKVVVYAPTERADKLPLFLLYSYMYSEMSSSTIPHSTSFKHMEKYTFFNGTGIITCVQLCEKHILYYGSKSTVAEKPLQQYYIHCPDTERPRNFKIKYTIFCKTVLDKKERTVPERNNNKWFNYHQFM